MRQRPIPNCARYAAMGAVLVIATAFQTAAAQAVVYIDVLNAHHRGVLGAPGRMHDALAALDALPSGADPTVVYVQSLSSGYTISNEIYSSDTSMYRQRVEVITAAAAEVGGPTPIFVATQWGTPKSRIIDARNMGRTDVDIFPTTAEELAATGYDFLIDPRGLVMRWDLDGSIPGFAASRRTVMGTEFILPVEIILCADSQRIVGWARGRRDFEPTDASLGRFTRACLRGELDQPETFVMPDDILSAYDLSGRYFALLLPYAYREPVPVASALSQAVGTLGLASTEVPLLVVATDTVTEDGTQYVTREEHASDLAAKGVEVDEALSAVIPDWVQGFVRHPATMLILVDDTGAPVAVYGASPSNPAGEPTLTQGLLRYGLF